MRKINIIVVFAVAMIATACSKKANPEPTYPSFIELSISQPYTVETGTKFEISVAKQDDATSYEWTLPSNFGLIEGDGTNRIVVKCLEEGDIAAGSIGVTAISGTGRSVTRKFWFDITIVPRVVAISSSIQGSQTLYPGEKITLSAPEIEGIQTYEWNCPDGFTATSALNESSVTYKAPSSFCTVPRGAFKIKMTDAEGKDYEYAFNKYIHIIDINVAKRYGKKAWMRTNLNNAGEDGNLGKVMNDDPTGEKYGRYYLWGEAMTGSSGAGDPYTDGDTVTDDEGNTFVAGYSGAKDFAIQIQGACPEGWHVPNAYDFYDLADGIADDYGVRRGTINDCANSKSGIFMPSNRETTPMAAMAMITNGFASSYVRGGRPVADGGLWKRNESTITADGYYFNSTATGVFPGNTNYPLYLDLNGEIGMSIQPYGRIESAGTNPNFGLYSFHWTATVEKTKHYRFTVGYNTCNLSTYAEGPGVYINLRCVANY